MTVVYGSLAHTTQHAQKQPGYMATTTDPSQQSSQCTSDIVCTQNLLITSTQAFVNEYQNLSSYYYTGLELEQQAMYTLVPSADVFLSLCIGSMFGFSLGADTFALLRLYCMDNQSVADGSITRVMGSNDAIVGAMYLSYWNTTYNVQSESDTRTVFRAIPTGQIALDPKCIPEVCKCKLGSCGLNDHFAVNLSGELQQVQLKSVSSIFLEISSSIVASTTTTLPSASSDNTLEMELLMLSSTMDQLSVNPVCADCCDKNCMLDFMLISVGDNKNCCSSVCCPETCMSAGVSISAIPIPVVALPPDCCDPCSGPTSGPCKTAWDEYVSKKDLNGEFCDAHTHDHDGIIEHEQHTEDGGTHFHELSATALTATPNPHKTKSHYTGNPEKNLDGAHSHLLKKPDGSGFNRHETGAQFVHEVLNSCLSKCCTFYFASTDGVFKQTGDVMWNDSSKEGRPSYASTHISKPDLTGGPKATSVGLEYWVLAAVKGVQIFPTALAGADAMLSDFAGMMMTKSGIQLPKATQVTSIYKSNFPSHQTDEYRTELYENQYLRYDDFM